MIETAFALVRCFLQNEQLKRSRLSQLTLRPTARAQLGNNDSDFLKEFSYV